MRKKVELLNYYKKKKKAKWKTNYSLKKQLTQP